MPDENTQAVVDEANTPPPAGSEAESARTTEDDLDKLLADYDAQTKPAAAVSPPEPTPPPPVQQVMVDPERFTRLEQRILQEDLNKAAEVVAGDTKASRRLVIGFLDQMARENPTLERAFRNQANDPKSWERILHAAAKEFQKDFMQARVDPQATEDRAAVIQAVRGASARQPEERPADYSNMSTQEYRQAIRKEYGFDPGV